MVDVTVCPACRWENDADSGPCAGCGRELSSSAPVREPEVPPLPEPTPDPEPPAEPQVTGGLLRGPSRPVPIRPQARPTPQVIEPQRGPAQSVDRGRGSPRPPADVAPSRAGAPPPVRDIPVVVAASGTRPAVRRRGDETGGVPDEAADLPALPQAGEGLCPSCGRIVRHDQYFCRCGAELPAAFPQRLRTPSEGDLAGLSVESFKRAQRRANGGRRVRYDQPLSPRTWLVRVLAVLTVVGALGSQVPPWGDDVRGWIHTRVADVAPW